MLHEKREGVRHRQRETFYSQALVATTVQLVKIRCSKHAHAVNVKVLNESMNINITTNHVNVSKQHVTNTMVVYMKRKQKMHDTNKIQCVSECRNVWSKLK